MSEPNGGKTEPNGGEGGGGTASGAQEQEYEALGDILVLSFTASPPTVQPFVSATLAWSVEVPTALDAPVEIGVGDEMSYGTSGTATVTPYMTTEYGLIAKTAIVERALTAVVTVSVDSSACVSANIPGTAITGGFRNQIASIFQGSSNYSLGDYTVNINEADSTIDINVPLVIEVPDWFNANMTMSGSIYITQEGLPPNASVLVQSRNVTANVSWSWYSNILSLGNTASAGAGMTQLAQVFLDEIVAQQVVAPMQNLVDQQIQASITAAQADHPGAGPYVLTSLGWDANQDLFWTLCPLPVKAPPQPGGPPPVAGGGPPPVISG
jgi:hypothetical protein